MTVCVVLQYGGKQYTVEDTWDDWTNSELQEDSMLFWWEDGNGACDCNRSLKIQSHCDPHFPEFDCGDLIELISLEIKAVQ